MSRPKNKDIGKELRDKYIKVMLTENEKLSIEDLANKEGIPTATYMRLRSLNPKDDTE